MERKKETFARRTSTSTTTEPKRNFINFSRSYRLHDKTSREPDYPAIFKLLSHQETSFNNGIKVRSGNDDCSQGCQIIVLNSASKLGKTFISLSLKMKNSRELRGSSSCFSSLLSHSPLFSVKNVYPAWRSSPDEVRNESRLRKKQPKKRKTTSKKQCKCKWEGVELSWTVEAVMTKPVSFLDSLDLKM